MSEDDSVLLPCKLNGADPRAYFADVLTRLINLWPASLLDQLFTVSPRSREPAISLHKLNECGAFGSRQAGLPMDRLT
jgi:hypothetical protein